MAGLRTVRYRLPYLLVVCCVLLLTYKYVFHDIGLPKWIFCIDTYKKVQSSSFQNYTNSVKDYNGSVINFHALELKSKSSVSKETSLNIEPHDTNELIKKNNPSIQQKSTSQKSMTAGLSYFISNVSNDKTIKLLKQNDGSLGNLSNVPLMKQNLENKLQDITNFNTYTNLALLVDIFAKKMRSVSVREKKFKPTCENDFKLANSCDNKKCLQTELPENLTTRVEQLVMPRRLQMSHKEHEILREMADKVKGNYEIILLTAASSNHFLESQALLKNLHETAFLHLKNFTLIFYNVGLTDQERSLMIKYCKCQVIDFPFEKFPHFMRRLRCYSFKPVVMKAHLQNGNILFWLDASIRFQNSSTKIYEFIQRTRERGVQIGLTSGDTTFRTYPSMYHFFGDEACAHLGFRQVASGFIVYNREYFVDRVILEPWVACALNQDCMCKGIHIPHNCGQSDSAAKKYYQGKGPIVYGLCHRFDQSALSLILYKLYQGLYPWIMVNARPVMGIFQNHKIAYFQSIINNT